MAHVCVLNNNHKTFLFFAQTAYNKRLLEEVVALILCLNMVVFLTPHNYNQIIYTIWQIELAFWHYAYVCVVNFGNMIFSLTLTTYQ